jgi:hypothetical protein
MNGRCLASLLLAALPAACDGTIQVRGRVYARSAGDTQVPSAAVVDRTGIDTTTLVPLSGASVTLFQRVLDTAAAAPESLLWVRRDTSRADGSFNLFDIGPPSAYTAALRVSRAGYRTTTVAFRHRSSRDVHRAVVVLTPLPK